jgi:hypothetical protein
MPSGEGTWTAATVARLRLKHRSIHNTSGAAKICPFLLSFFTRDRRTCRQHHRS